MAIRVWLPALLLAFLLAASPFTQGNMHHRVTPPVLSLSLSLSFPATQIRCGKLPLFVNSAPWQR
jgi:hypothetical protein